jgi:hypothetical protein
MLAIDFIYRKDLFILPVINYIHNYAISEILFELIELIGKFTIFLPLKADRLIAI